MLICFGLVSPNPVFSQTGKLILNLEYLKVLDSAFKNKSLNYTLTIGGFIKTDGQIYPQSIMIDSLPSGRASILLDSYTIVQGYQRNYSVFLEVNIDSNSTTNAKVIFPKDCSYNRNSVSKVCPKCHKSDKVIPIYYGLRTIPFDPQGNLIKEPRHISGGCVLSDCNPTWFCERNKLRF